MRFFKGTLMWIGGVWLLAFSLALCVRAINVLYANYAFDRCMEVQYRSHQLDARPSPDTQAAAPTTPAVTPVAPDDIAASLANPAPTNDFQFNVQDTQGGTALSLCA
jgi:hypothetical protein